MRAFGPPGDVGVSAASLREGTPARRRERFDRDMALLEAHLW
jgi:hypothetical protein